MIPLNLQQYGNPIEFQVRIPIDIEENETASYVPSYFFVQADPPKSNYHLPVSQLRKIQYREVVSDLDAINRLANDIKDHVETKIQLFFYQLVLVSGLGLKFFEDKAYYQAGITSPKEPDQPNLPPDFKGVEAHCATLVTLLASDRLKYESCFVSEDDAIERVFFADNTFFGRSWSSMTVTLPSCVNILDSNFEWIHKARKYADKIFREVCIKIVNNVSSSKIDPVTGLIHYLVKGVHYLTKVREGNRLDYKVRINDIYLEVFSKYIELFSEEKKQSKMLKALSFSALLPGEADIQLTHHFMFGKLQEEMGIQRNLLAISQRIKVSLNIKQNDYKQLRIVTKGVALRITSSNVAKWFEDYITENKHHTSKTIAKYVQLCVKDVQFVGQAVQYLNGRTVVQIEEDFRNGIEVAPLNDLVIRIVKCAGKKIKNEPTILLHSLHFVSTTKAASTPHGERVRQVLCLNDSMMPFLLEHHPQWERDINFASSNPDVRNAVSLL